MVVNEEFIATHKDNPEMLEPMYLQYQNLIRKTAHNFKLKGYDYDDLVSEGYLVFIRALQNWKPELGIKFSTYFGKCLDSHYKCLFRFSNTLSRGREFTTISIYAPIHHNNTRDLYVEDIMKEDKLRTPFTGVSTYWDMLERYLNTLSERDAFIMRNYLYDLGYSQWDIAHQYNISQPTISRVIAKHRKVIQKNIARNTLTTKEAV